MGLIMPGTQHEKAGNPFLIASFYCFLSRICVLGIFTSLFIFVFGQPRVEAEGFEQW